MTLPLTPVNGFGFLTACEQIQLAHETLLVQAHVTQHPNEPYPPPPPPPPRGGRISAQYIKGVVLQATEATELELTASATHVHIIYPQCGAGRWYGSTGGGEVVALFGDIEREREFHQSIQPALAYEDASLLESSATLRMAARQWQTAFWSLCHTKHCMVPSAS